MAEGSRDPAARAPSFAELLGELGREVAALVRDEIDLAKKELRAEVARTLRAGVAAAVLAVLLALASLLTLCAAAVLALARVIDPAWAALAVGVAAALAALASAAVARRRLRPQGLAPRATVETLKEDREWVKELGRR